MVCKQSFILAKSQPADDSWKRLQWLLILGVMLIVVTGGFWVTVKMTPLLASKEDFEQLLVEPDASRFSFINAISTAKHSIDLTANKLTDTHIIQALEAAAKHGVKVRILLNPFFTEPNSGMNLQQQLQKDAIELKFSQPNQDRYNYQKILLVDDKYFFVMTFDFEKQSFTTYRNPRRNFSLLLSDPKEIAKLSHWVANGWNSGGLSFNQELASTRVPSTQQIVDFIKTAKQDINLYAYRMVDPAMNTALITAVENGIAVSIVVSNDAARQDKVWLEKLKRAGVRIRVLDNFLNGFIVVISDDRLLQPKAYIKDIDPEPSLLSPDKGYGFTTYNLTTIKNISRVFAKDWKEAKLWDS